jgi:hypothetical protein
MAAMSISPGVRTTASLLWLAIKIIVVMLLANSEAAQFVYQNF